MQIPENILVLIEKYQTGRITADEKKLLDEWYHSFNDSEVELAANENETEQQLTGRIKSRLAETLGHEQDRTVIYRPRQRWLMPAAAAGIVMLFLSVAVYMMISSRSANKEIVKNRLPGNNPKTEITPGGNKALLILADGSTVILDSTANGTISEQGNIKVQKLSNGLLAYVVNGKLISENDEAFFNTISTPRGGQYQVTLSDGTKVWLNAASSIRFPVVFTGKERKVEITGEAYFEVAKNKAMPFKVKASSSEVEVLGTHFNVNSYDDEASIKTTLLEGSVKVSAGNQPPKYLKPGQQAGISKEGKIDVMSGVDLEEAIAWKNGLFIFNSTDVKSIMRQISRWYDVDVEYRGNVNLHFTGQLTRNENVANVFEKIALTGEVHFKIDGKKIIVSP